MIQGTVTNVYTKQWGDKTFYSLKVTDGVTYGFGTFRPNAKEGDKVEFEAKQNQKGYWEGLKGTLKVTPGTGENVAQGASAAVVGRATGKSAGSEDFWAKKELREIKNDHLRSLGASRNTAIEWIKALVAAEAIKLPTKQADREAALNELFNDYVRKFMEDIDSAGGVTRVAPVKAPTADSPTEDAGQADGVWE